MRPKSRSDLSLNSASSRRSRKRRRQVPNRAISGRTYDLLGLESLLASDARIAVGPRHVVEPYNPPTSKLVGTVIAMNSASTIRTTKNRPAAIKNPESVPVWLAAPCVDGTGGRAGFIAEVAVTIDFLCSYSCFRARFSTSVFSNNPSPGNFIYHSQ